MEEGKPAAADADSDDLVFVSYAHSNADAVMDDIRFLQSEGVAIWYDQGISPGSRWTQEIADAIESSSVFIAFVSGGFVASENCINEVEFAVNKGKRVLQVYLEDTEIPTGLELSLAGRQAIAKHALDQETYRENLGSAIGSLLADTSGVQSRVATAAGTRQRSPWLPVLIVAAVVAIAVVMLNREESADSVAPPVTQANLRAALAVLPFDNELDSPDSQHFADAVADDLIIRLGNWQQLPVVSRVVSFATDLPAAVGELGAALDARYLVRGRLYQDRDQETLRIYLVDAATGQDVWTGSYEQASVLAHQTEIVDAIVGEVNPILLEAESVRAVRESRTEAESLDAWTAAMRGWWYVNQDTKEGLDTSRQWFESAIELDPTWAWPHAALALSHYRAMYNSWADDPRQSGAVLIEASTKAINLDPQDAFAHHAYGHGLAAQGRVEDALRALARGVELAPHNAMANSCLGMQLAGWNRGDEAVKYAERAMEISPNDPWLHRFALVRARGHFALAEYAEAEEWALRSQQLRPSFGAFLHSVAAPALGEGLDRAQERVTQAIAGAGLPPVGAIEQGFSRTNDPDYVARLVEGLRRGGFPE